MRITRKSIISGEVHTLDLPVTEGQITRYLAGVLAQDAFPHLDAGQREFLISGTTPEEWDDFMGSDPDDEDAP